MGDCTDNFFVESPITIKEEPLRDDTTMSTTASVPIPTRRLLEIADYRDIALELDNTNWPYTQYSDGSLTMWCNDHDESIKTEALIRMDEDDIFQVDKADLIQGPTLAELNANDETLLGDLNFDDLLLPEEGGNCMPPRPPFAISNVLNNNPAVTAASSCPQPGMFFYRDPEPQYEVYTPAIPSSSSNSSPAHVVQPKHSALHELLLKKDEGQVAPSRQNLRVQRAHASRLSSSAPNNVSFADIWQRREPRKHLLSTGSLAEAGSTSSISTGVLSPDPQDFSHDELDTDEESEHYEDVSSDNDSDDDDHLSKHGGASKKERFFWQYNVQAKGPKGQRLVMKCKMEDPHVLHEITDPVFSPSCSVRGIKHSGKARKGDGNDLTPNARKLFNIGKELDKLGRVINDMTPVSELPFNVRPKSRKEKNKLASRACRLKKKAQHEANKIKLSGLEIEHRNLLTGIGQSRELVMAKLQEQPIENQEELTARVENILRAATKMKVAGFSTEYVNKILDRLKKGQPLEENN